MDILLAFVPVAIIGAALFLQVTMLIHAVKSNIPNKWIWLLIIIFGSTIGNLVYYWVVYRHTSKTGARLNKRVVILIGLSFLILVLSVGTARLLKSNNLREVPFEDVVQLVNNGQVKRIEVRGDELDITKSGEDKPSLRSHRDTKMTLIEQGLELEKTEIFIKSD